MSATKRRTRRTTTARRSRTATMSTTSTTATVTSSTTTTFTNTDGISLPTRIADAVDQLPAGTVYLSVPHLDDAIQVGTDQPLPAATIEVRKTSSAMEVRRTDGKPLRVQIISRPTTGLPARTDVFTAPLPALRIERVRRSSGPQSWSIPAAPTRRHDAVMQLVETIVSFSAVKRGPV